jgi:predicted 3-demethylubiquinone-9 3-methyltransferase (glyoxalase superfamily)
MSIFVNCDTQEEIDDLWEKPSEGGEKRPCGWLKDRYSVSWQIVPTVLGEFMQDAEPARSRRVMEALLKMTRIRINTLRKACERR